MRQRVKLKCSGCGNVYEVIPARKDTSKYCSRKCLHAYRYHDGSIQKKISKSVKRLHEIGDTYGHEWLEKHKVERGTSWNSGTATKIKCVNCGDIFKALGKRKYVAKYRSLKCRGEYSNKNKDYEKIKYYNEVWRIIRKQSLHLLENYHLRGRSKKKNK